ncbi:MAG: hypothetical protein CW346_20490, partial [Bacillaceae bacterium]|nr:hypothetical protein [Bacillaceae bacterium]
KDEPHRQKEKAGGRLPLPLLIFRHSFVCEEAETAKIFTAERNDRRTIRIDCLWHINGALRIQLRAA